MAIWIFPAQAHFADWVPLLLLISKLSPLPYWVVMEQDTPLLSHPIQSLTQLETLDLQLLPRLVLLSPQAKLAPLQILL
jgi:hypothetical protein